VKEGGNEVIKLGENSIPYHKDFRFYMTTKLRNPHYTPETSVKVTLLNFTVTPDGLEDQLLGLVVAEERPDLEEMKNQLVVKSAAMKKEIKGLEDKILELMGNAEGDILEDESLINTLADSKVTSNDISEQVKEAEATEQEIDTTRQKYRPVAYRASILYFTIADMAIVDPMYQYSLSWFIQLFLQGIGNAPKSDVLEERLFNLNDYFTYSLYQNLCRSLFEKHKLLFSFLLCIRIMQGDNKVDPVEWRFLLTGGQGSEPTKANPASSWLTERAWAELHNLSLVEAFKGLEEDIIENVTAWKKYFDSSDPQKPERFPGKWGEESDLRRLLILRCLRADKVQDAVMQVVENAMGERFISPPPFDMSASYNDSSVTMPLIFVLSMGADPFNDLYKFTQEMNMQSKFDYISLGQGQGPIAQKMIETAQQRGSWVLLQNCHLATSWMPTLERICEQTNADNVHRDYRLWLTSMPTPQFPVSVLQDGIKMTNEPPKGLKANLTRSFAGYSDDFLNDCQKPQAFKKLLFSLCTFHAIVQDRRKFGPLGWNILYDFAQGDLLVSQMQLKLFLDDYDEIPFKVLHYLVSQINYGGRVTDDWDRRLTDTILEDYMSEKVLKNGYTFSPSGIYYIPESEEHSGIMDYIKSLPINPHPEVFGLHENADITSAQNEAYEMFETILALQPRTASGGGKTREEVIDASAEDILSRIPDVYDLESVGGKYPTTYNESMNTVLVQECLRYNGVVAVIKRSLVEVRKALKGIVVMSESLEQVASALFNNTVPEMWAAKAYPSLKPLSAWVQDLAQRLHFIQQWIDHGTPSCFWMSGFFFPQAFLTGTLQNFARKYVLPIDAISFDFKVVDHLNHEDVKEKPEDGCYVYGLFLEGAIWDPTEHTLAEARPKEVGYLPWPPSPPSYSSFPARFRRHVLLFAIFLVVFSFFFLSSPSSYSHPCRCFTLCRHKTVSLPRRTATSAPPTRS